MNLSMRNIYWAAIWSLLVTGCAFRGVNTLSRGQVPAERPVMLALGPVLVTDSQIAATDKDFYRLHFEEGLKAWFSRTNNLGTVVLADTNAAPRSIVLSGTILTSP